MCLKTAGHPNVIVFDNDALMRFYGPTIAGSPQFSLRVARSEPGARSASGVDADEVKSDEVKSDEAV